MTLLTELIILGLFAMSLDLMVGYAQPGFVRPRRGLWARRLCLRLHAAELVHAAARRRAACRVVDRDRGDRRGLGMHACNRRVVFHADVSVRTASLCHRLQVDLRDRWQRRPRRHSAPARPLLDDDLNQQDRLLLFRACLLDRRLFHVPRAGTLTVWIGARWYPRERSQDLGAGLQHSPLQDHGDRDCLCAGRARWRTLRTVRGLRQHGVARFGCCRAKR